MLANWRGLFALAGLIVAMGLVGCSGLSPATPSVEGPVISEPLAALVNVRADPPIAEQAVAIRLHPLNSTSGPMEFQFEAGERIAAEDARSPGPYRATVNDVECSGTVNLVAGQETDVLITLDPAGGCTVIAAGVRVPGGADSGSAVSGQVTGPYPPDSVVRIVSSDDPPNPVPDPGKPVEGGSFLFPFLVPGRYVIALVSDGAVLTQVPVETAPGEEQFVTLVAPSP